MRRALTANSGRRPWVASAIWGWRLELSLTVAGSVVLFLSTRCGDGVPVLVAGLAGILLWAQPACMKQLAATLQRNAQFRRLHAALWRCAVVGRNGQIPTVVRTATLPVGRRYLVALPVGLHFELMEARSAELAAALGVREVRVKPIPQNARYVEIVVITKPAFEATSSRSPLLVTQRVSLWDPILLATAEDGLPVWLGLPEHNLLIGGEPGSGKSVALSTIIAATALDPDVRLTLLDGKHVELAAWRSVATRFVGSDQEDAVSALEELRDEMDGRFQSLLERGQRKIEPSGEFGLHVVVIDELAFFLRGGKKESREKFSELLRDLISRGRAAGIIVVAATQKPSHEIVPTWIRDLFAFRLALRCSSSDASDTILGQGWAHQGFSATTIDPSQRGVGYLLAEGGTPVLLKTPFLSDADIEVIVSRAKKLRSDS